MPHHLTRRHLLAGAAAYAAMPAAAIGAAREDVIFITAGVDVAQGFDPTLFERRRRLNPEFLKAMMESLLRKKGLTCEEFFGGLSIDEIEWQSLPLYTNPLVRESA